MSKVSFERVDPATNSVRVVRTEAALTHEAGDVVSTPRGVGVVSAAMTEPFEFPTSSGQGERVQASGETPAYIVGFGGRSAPYRGSALTEGDLYNPRRNGRSRDALVSPIAERGLADEALRANWGKRDLLHWWSTAGGLWRRAREHVKRERGVEDEEAQKIASRRKDAVLGTNRWRTRF